MTKIRVYELAHNLGIDNKELIARLRSIGVEVKSHTSVIEESDAKQLTAPPPVKDVEKDEVRVTTTVIRRRAKHVETPVEEPAVPVESKVEEEAVKLAEIPQPEVEVMKPLEAPKEPQVKK
jgi:translation initiation factor IF-2